MRRLNAVVFIAGVAVGCGGGSNNSVDASGGGSDAGLGDGLSRCDTDGPPRALLVSIGANDLIELYALHPNHIVSTGIKITGVTTPSSIAMRPDGREALVAFGGFGSPFGVAVISVEPDASAAQLKQTISLGSGSTPVSLTYADADHAVVALLGVNDEIVGLTRGSTGFVANPRVASPADYPLAVRARPGSADVLMSRSQVGVDMTMDIYRLKANATSWQSVGPHASVGPYPIAFAIHASGAELYVPTSDPASPVTATNLLAPGQLHGVVVGGTGFTDGGTVVVPRIPTLLAPDPGGRFVVTDGAVYKLDNSNNPQVIAYTWQTIRTGANGALGEVSAMTPPADGLLFDDFAVAPTGHLIAMRELYIGTVPPAQQYPLELWAQPSWGMWQLCETTHLLGGAHIGISP